MTKKQWENLLNELDSIYNPEYNTTTVGGYSFVLTCSACPEQYDVYKGSYKDGEKVAYVRKRWGHLCVHPVKNHETDYDSVIYEEYDNSKYRGVIDNRRETFLKIVYVLNKMQENVI